ncbi:hypothetical protein [Deinococcus sp. Arct2-2]|nr:hypothetical protein [Deinococcus sp. Arct2-2]
MKTPVPKPLAEPKMTVAGIKRVIALIKKLKADSLPANPDEQRK